jgi:hypothetical protein
MYVARASWPSSNGKSYQSIYLRESFRDGHQVRKRNIANLTHCDPKEIAAIELALKFKGNLSVLSSLDKPDALPHTDTPVVTRKQLPTRRKPR